MNAPPPAPAPVPTPPPDVATAWPRSAQLATAFLIGVAVTLLGLHLAGSLRWSTRPGELERGAAYRIDLNRATRAELLQVPGIGPSLADRIVEHRRDSDFRSVDDLRQVHGVGAATLERVRPWLCVNDAPVATVERRSLYSGAMEPEMARPVMKKETLLAVPLDINAATSEELQRLSGIGPVLAQRIIEERGKRPYKSVDDLLRVSGIGPKILERLRPNVTVNLPAKPEPALIE